MSLSSEFPLVVSYFTPGTVYEKHAEKLRASVNRLGLDCLIEPRQSRGTWVQNCAQKASFVLYAWKQAGRSICWIDADAILTRIPIELEHFVEDFAVVKRAGWDFYGGQIAFNQTAPAAALLESWCWYCENFPNIWDQVSLGYAWWDISLVTGVNTRWLREEIFEKYSSSLFKRLCQHVLRPSPIMQRHEGRSAKTQPMRRSTHTDIGAEYPSSQIPKWWRRAAMTDSPFSLSEAQRGELGIGRFMTIDASR